MSESRCARIGKSSLSEYAGIGLGVVASIALYTLLNRPNENTEKLRAEVQRVQTLNEAKDHLVYKAEYPDGRKSFTIRGDFDAAKLAELRTALSTAYCQGYNTSFDNSIDRSKYYRQSSTRLECRLPEAGAEAPTR